MSNQVDSVIFNNTFNILQCNIISHHLKKKKLIQSNSKDPIKISHFDFTQYFLCYFMVSHINFSKSNITWIFLIFDFLGAWLHIQLCMQRNYHGIMSNITIHHCADDKSSFYEVKIWIILSSGCVTILSLCILCCLYWYAN